MLLSQKKIEEKKYQFGWTEGQLSHEYGKRQQLRTLGKMSSK